MAYGEKMTAVWLILLTIIVCAAVPAAMIWLTSQPKPEFVLGLELYSDYTYNGIQFNTTELPDILATNF